MSQGRTVLSSEACVLVYNAIHSILAMQCTQVQGNRQFDIYIDLIMVEYSAYRLYSLVRCVREEHLWSQLSEEYFCCEFGKLWQKNVLSLWRVNPAKVYINGRCHVFAAFFVCEKLQFCENDSKNRVGLWHVNRAEKHAHLVDLDDQVWPPAIYCLWPALGLTHTVQIRAVSCCFFFVKPQTRLDPKHSINISKTFSCVFCCP